MRLKLLITAFLLAGGATAWAQGVDNSMLLQPPADSWPQYNGTYNAQRHAKLKQITPQNVGTLALAWAFQTKLPGEIKSTPLLVDGVIYFTTVDNVWALDALSGRQLWHYYVSARVLVCILAAAGLRCTRTSCIFWFLMAI